MKIELSPSFERTFRRLVRQNRLDEAVFWKRTEVFLQNPFDPTLKTHKLSGRLKDLWAFSLGHDLRVVFYFFSPDQAVFVDIGTHDEVY